MPVMKGNYIIISAGVTPETFIAIEESRGKLSRNAFCGIVLEELLGSGNTASLRN